MQYQPIISRFPNTGIRLSHTSDIPNYKAATPAEFAGEGYIAHITFVAEEGKTQPILKFGSKPCATEYKAVETLFGALNESYAQIARLYTKKVDTVENSEPVKQPVRFIDMGFFCAPIAEIDCEASASKDFAANGTIRFNALSADHLKDLHQLMSNTKRIASLNPKFLDNGRVWDMTGVKVFMVPNDFIEGSANSCTVTFDSMQLRKHSK